MLPHLPMCLRRALVIVTAGLACLVSGNAHADDDLVSPGGAGARYHFQPSVRGAAEDQLSDSLARKLYESVVEAAHDTGRAVPQLDARLAAMAEVIASSMKRNELPGVELQEFLLSHFGFGDLPPHLIALQVGASDNTIRDTIARDLPAAMRENPFARMGIGLHRKWFRTTVVVALQVVDVEMLPVPRRLELGGSVLLGGRLLNGYHDARVFVASPSGDVRTLPVRSSRDSFQTSLRCDRGPGKHQIEITALSRAGKTVVANFPVYCGVSPPVVFARTMVARSGPVDVLREERAMFAVVNRDRVANGLRLVAWDDALAGAARRYSEEMAMKQLVRHVSADSGNAADRVRRAGAQATVVFENVARAVTVEDAERSLLSSPAHRANLLHPSAVRLGIGVAVRQGPTGGPMLYFTQLFAR